MQKRTIEIEIVRAGQPRPYADTVYESILRYSGDVGSDPDEVIVRQEAKVLVHMWFDTPEWHQARLTKIEKLAKGEWRVIINQPYLD